MMSPIKAMPRARRGLLNSKKMGNSERVKTSKEPNAEKMRKCIGTRLVDPKVLLYREGANIPPTYIFKLGELEIAAIYGTNELTALLIPRHGFFLGDWNKLIG
jgi:hypothetical protein